MSDIRPQAPLHSVLDCEMWLLRNLSVLWRGASKEDPDLTRAHVMAHLSVRIPLGIAWIICAWAIYRRWMWDAEQLFRSRAKTRRRMTKKDANAVVEAALKEQGDDETKWKVTVDGCGVEMQVCEQLS